MNYNKFLKGYNQKLPNLKTLECVHCSNQVNGKDIIDVKKIISKLCPNFNKELIYFFYGNPSYVSGKKTKEKIEYSKFVQVAFLMKFEDLPIEENSMAYPFDTGAIFSEFILNKNSEIKIRKDNINEFRFEITTENLKKHIECFFHSNINYYESNFKKLENESEIYNYLHLYMEEVKKTNLDRKEKNKAENIDSRALSTELLINCKEIDLEKISAIVIPRTLFNEVTALDWIIKNNIQILDYSVGSMRGLGSYNDAIFQEIYKYYRNKGYFSDNCEESKWN